METIREDNIASSLNIKPLEKQMISIFDLGNSGKQMLEAWQEIKKTGSKISFKEFSTVNLYQTIANDKNILDFVLEFLLMIEDKNKEMVKERQALGIAKAKQNGVKLGRKPIAIPKEFGDVYKQVVEKKISIAKATRILNIDYKTFKKWEKQCVT